VNRRDQELLDKALASSATKRKQLETIEEWAKAAIALHQPYVSGRMDVSLYGGEKAKEKFLAELGRNLWCCECSTRWPCKSTGPLKMLRDVARGSADLDEVAVTIQNMQLTERSGYIHTAV
jgi:hypothetical protein